MIKKAIKIFRVNDYEWWAGIDIESIGAAYKEATGIDPADDDEGFDNPYEVSEAGMSKLIHWGEGEPDGEQAKCTFAEMLQQMIAQGQEFPCYFAGTEY